MESNTIRHKIIFDPQLHECAAYYMRYVNLVPNDSDVLHYMYGSGEDIKTNMLLLPDDILHYRYREDKWTIKEVLVHMIDTERIFAYRALCFARNDKTPLPGYEENDYAPASEANKRTIQNILDEYKAVRIATIELFKNFSNEQLQRSGIANNTRMSVCALLYAIAGHEAHHMNVIKERYLSTYNIQ